MTQESRFSVKSVLSDAALYLESNQKMMRMFWLANFLFLILFRFIEGGFSNRISIFWLLAYYIYWCVFFRVYYDKKPYFDLRAFLGSAGPSIKIVFITLLVALLLALLPYLPLLMGFNGRYLVFFEEYMAALENIEANILNQVVFSLILILISPLIICRPYFAWISSILGLSGSMRKAFRKTEGNYFQFILAMLFLNLPCVLVLEADKYLQCHGWLAVSFYSIFFLYFNLVFAKMYDFFYHTND